MPSESSTTKVSLSSKTTESRCLAIANLPDTATEDTVTECFKRYGRVHSVRIDDQRYGFVAFLDVRTASKAHHAENILDEQRLRTAFHDGSTLVPKALLEPLPPAGTAASSSSSSNASAEQPSPLTSTVIDPSFVSSPNTPTVTSCSTSKLLNGEREKRPSRTHASPDDNVRHQVVPVKRDSDSSGSKRKNTSTNISKTSNSSHPPVQKPSHRKHENSSSSSSSSSSSESERSSDDSVSCKPQRRKLTKNHSAVNDSSMGKTKILKVYHLPAKTPKDSLRESLWNLFVDFKKAGRLLTVKVDGEHALLTFRKAEDVEKALLFATGKSINGTRVKVEPYDASTPDNEECDPVKRSTCPDPEIDEYSVKATRTLYIGNLQSEISYNELREAYSAYGDIIELEIKRQTQSQHQLPFAFVQYADIKSVVKAMKAFDSKGSRDHSIKLGFGKSQPTNVLWLDDLSLNTSESVLRTSIMRITNFSNEQVLDIYIDNRNQQKSQTAQCLIYFSDTRVAQEAINLIRGKKIDSRKIQIDFASKVFVTRFSDIIEETSHKKNYAGYPPDPPVYHGESRAVTKRNVVVPEPIQAFESPVARTTSGDRWPNAYNNSNRLPHKNDARHSSDRRHSKEYGKGSSNSLLPIPSGDNGTLAGSSLTSRRHRLSTSSKDSLSNNVSSGRHPHRVGRPRRHPSSTTSLSSCSSSSSSQSSTSTNSVERRSSSHQKHSNSKHASKSAKKPVKSTNNAKASTKKASSTKEQSIKSSQQRSRPGKDEEPSTSQQQQQPEIIVLPSLSLGEQIESIKKDPPATKQPSASPKAASKNTERVFDWLMQNHQQDSNSSMGLDQNDDDDNLIKSKIDDDSLENVSDEQTSKTSPPIPNNHHSASTPLTPSASNKNAKLDKAALPSSYRLQPIRAGGKRDEQSDNSLTANDTHLSSSPPPPVPVVPPTSAPLTPTPLSAPPVTVSKEESEPTNPRRVNRPKNPLTTNQMKKIPLDCHASYDQLDVRLKSYPSLFNDHLESIRLPFPQFAFEHIKTSATASNVLVVLNPKAHLKHSSLGLNNPSTTTTTKHETSIDTNNNTNAVTNSNDDELSTARIPLDERIRLLDKQMNEMTHGAQKSATSSSSSSSSSSLSPATLIEQQNLKSSTAGVKDLALTLSSSTTSATLNQCIQAARAALSAQPPAKTPLPIPSSSPFSFPVTPVPALALNRPLSVTSPSPVNLSSVLVAPPPPPPPFPSLQRLSDPASHSILNFHAALAQTQMAAVAKYNPLQFPTTLHPPPPPVPASLISPLTCPRPLPTPPPPALSLPHRSTSLDLPEPTPNSPSTSSAKILERLGPSAKFKRKPIPPPLAVVTTPLLPSPDATSGGNAHHSPVPASSPVLQHQLSNSSSSSGLKSILKQRSLSNSSSVSPTNERKTSTNYVSPLASSESRQPSQSLSTTSKRTPPTTPIPVKKKESGSVFSNDIDERQADEKKSTWRAPPTKPSDSPNVKKQILDKIPKKASATTPKSNAAQTPPSKAVKSISSVPMGSKVAQLTLDRIDPKSLKTSVESAKVKRAIVIQSDSDTEKRPVSKTKKPLLNNEITKRKQQHQQQQKSPMLKKTLPVKTKSKAVTTGKKSELHSSASELDEKRTESTATHSDEDLISSDNDEKHSVTKKRTKNKKSTKPRETKHGSSSMYDIVKKRARSEQTRHSSLSTSEDHLSDDNTDEDNHPVKDDSDEEKDRDVDEHPVTNRSKRHNVIEDSSESEPDERPAKSKGKTALVFDNNIFDDEDSDEKSKSSVRKKKVEPEAKASVKKSILKTNNEQPRKDPPGKSLDEAKKKIAISKTGEKKKPTVNTPKTISKIIKSNNAAQKRPSTDDANEPAKKLKTDGEKVKSKPVEEPTPKVETETPTPAIVVTKSEETATPPTTPSKFGIVFASHRRQSTATTPPSTALRTPSKNDDEEMTEETKPEATVSTTNTLKPPVNAGQTALSDDETLNPETMQLSDLIGSSRREGPEPVKSRSGTKALAKGKRPAKKETTSNKRQPGKGNGKAMETSESEEQPSVEPAAVITGNVKRLSTTEPTSTPLTNADKHPKRLRTSTGEATTTVPVKTEPVELPPVCPAAPVKGEPVESIIPAAVVEQKEVPVPSVEPPVAVRTPMEIDPIVSTSPETETAIKAVYPSIQIATPTIAKLSNPEKSAPIIASISKETLPIVEHQPPPIVPAHLPIKPPITSTSFNETVEETLSAVNSLLMLNNNPPNPSGDHQALKGTARVTPTISKPVYSFVASLPSPTNLPSRPATTNLPTPTSQPTDLIALVSNIVSSSNLNGEKQPAAAPARSHIEEVIDDVAKGALNATTSPTSSEPTSSIVESSAKATPIPHILRDVMKTPCLTTPTTSTVTSETLNLFDAHRRATSPLKTTSTASAAAITTTTNVSSTVASATPVVPVVARPSVTKTPTSHKRSSTPKSEPPASMLHPFPHLLTPDSSLFAAAHHPNFSFSMFGPNPNVNASSNLLTSPLVSSSPPLATRTTSTTSNSSNPTAHLVNNPFLNTIMSGQQQQSSTSNASHGHEKSSRRDSTTKVTGASSSSRSTPIQQTVPVPIPLTIPSSSSGTISNVAAHQQQQRQQPSPLMSTLDVAAAMRQQSSPLPAFLGPDSVVPFRNVYAESSDLYGPPPGLLASQNMAYAAATQMLNVIGMSGTHHPSAAAAFAAELYSNADSYFRMNPPASELSRDPYNVQWQGNLILKNDQAYVRTQLVAGSPQIARASMNYWNSDSLCSNPSGLSPASHHNLRISQRMRLEQTQLEGVQKRMQMDNDHCILIAEPNGSTPDEIRLQQNNLKNGVIRYFDEKKAAGIVNVLLPGASQPAYVVHIFPPCQFASEILQRRAPDTYRCVVQNKIEQIYLLIVITSTVQ